MAKKDKLPAPAPVPEKKRLTLPDLFAHLPVRASRGAAGAALSLWLETFISNTPPDLQWLSGRALEVLFIACLSYTAFGILFPEERKP
jgi:hypothetical protein